MSQDSQENIRDRRDFVAQIHGAAEQHGDAADPDHEVGDLQDCLSYLIQEVLTDEQLNAVRDGDNAITEIIEEWDGVF